MFIQEASGRQQEQQLMAAQSTVNNARKASLTAAWNLFVTNLSNDEVKQDKFLVTAEMSSARTRSVLVQSLEARIIKKSLSLVWLETPHQMIFGVWKTPLAENALYSLETDQRVRGWKLAYMGHQFAENGPRTGNQSD